MLSVYSFLHSCFLFPSLLVKHPYSSFIPSPTSTLTHHHHHHLTCRYREDYQPKAVKFADGILPGEGTSPSGGEEIHSPPPPAADTTKKKEKKFRKKRKVKVKVIKLVSNLGSMLGTNFLHIYFCRSCCLLLTHRITEYLSLPPSQYNGDDGGGSSVGGSPPPPPPSSSPPLAALKLYPGYTHYSFTAPGTAVIYTQQPQHYGKLTPHEPLSGRKGLIRIPS